MIIGPKARARHIHRRPREEVTQQHQLRAEQNQQVVIPKDDFGVEGKVRGDITHRKNGSKWQILTVVKNIEPEPDHGEEVHDQEQRHQLPP